MTNAAVLRGSRNFYQEILNTSGFMRQSGFFRAIAVSKEELTVNGPKCTILGLKVSFAQRMAGLSELGWIRSKHPARSSRS